MNVDILIIGLIALILGLIGLAIKSNMKEYPHKSYTGAKFLWSSYLLLGVGSFLIIWSFFSE
jgi:hypothetical protein